MENGGYLPCGICRIQSYGTHDILVGWIQDFLKHEPCIDSHNEKVIGVWIVAMDELWIRFGMIPISQI